MGKVYLWQLSAPFGMREVKDEGIDIWQFFNALNQPIGPCFRFSRKPTERNLASLHRGYYCRSKDILFCTADTFGSKDYWHRLSAVLAWQLAEIPQK